MPGPGNDLIDELEVAAVGARFCVADTSVGTVQTTILRSEQKC